QGTSLAPSAHQPPGGQSAGGPPPSPSAAPRPPVGFRWIAVRPGPPPPPRRRSRPLGPTPRYQSVPRWGLIDYVAAPPDAPHRTVTRSPSPATARAVLIGTAVVFALAAGVHVVRYLLLLINRTTLLPPFVAFGSLVSGIFISLAAIVAVIATGVTLTSWLIARRAAAFAVHGQDDPRPEWALWAGCLIPGVNLVWAPVFVLELANAEPGQERQRGPVALWWIGWALSCLICGWAIWTSRATDAQGVADNTATVIVAYLAGLAVLVLLWRVLDGFVRKPVDRPQHRWVIAPADALREAGSEEAESGAGGPAESAVESRDREPAA
nr:DUF4328 domain-containing protein [Mycobacterium sp.]